MKILAIHNYHRKGSASGDDYVFDAETFLLEQYGHKVIRYTVTNDEFDNMSIVGKFRAIIGMFWSKKNYKIIQKIIKEEKIDIVHIHTFFPLMSPSVLYAAKRCNVSVIATLHDTRFICPCATSLRGEELCNKCADGRYFRMCKYACFKKSKVQSIIVALIFKYHRIRHSFYNQIDKYICLNDNQIKLLENAGFDKKRIVKKYNFVINIENSIRKCIKNVIFEIPNRYIVFYGRIGEEKGVRNLMKMWDDLDIPLVVMGGGPLEVEFALWAKNKNSVYYLGYVEHSKCVSIVKQAEFVVFPSIWYEGCSMVEIEAQSLGKGIVATNLGFSMEAITNGVNGYKVEIGNIDMFKHYILILWNNPQLCKTIGKNAKMEYKKKYMPEDNYMQLISIYKDCIVENRKYELK